MLRHQPLPQHAPLLLFALSSSPELLNPVASHDKLPAQHYLDHDAKLRKFVPLIQRALVYPVVLDARRTVLSLPPIINGAHSAARTSCILAHTRTRSSLLCAAWHATVLVTNGHGHQAHQVSCNMCVQPAHKAVAEAATGQGPARQRAAASCRRESQELSFGT